MADNIVVRTGAMVDDLGLIVNVQSPKPPFQVGTGILAKTYKVGTDFTSGDTLSFQVEASSDVRFAAFTNAKGVALAYTKVAVPSVSGFALTLDTVVTTDVRALIIFDI